MGEWRTLPPFGTLKADSFSCFIIYLHAGLPKSSAFLCQVMIVPNSGSFLPPYVSSVTDTQIINAPVSEEPNDSSMSGKYENTSDPPSPQ
jgi:hypothetical protein